MMMMMCQNKVKNSHRKSQNRPSMLIVTCSLSRLGQESAQLQDALLLNTNRLFIILMDIPSHWKKQNTKLNGN